MSIKDLGFIKFVGGAIKKGKDKISSALKPETPKELDESVLDTLKSAFGSSKSISEDLDETKKVSEKVDKNIDKQNIEKQSVKLEEKIPELKSTVKKETKKAKDDKPVTKSKKVKTASKSVNTNKSTPKKKPAKVEKSKKEQKIELYTKDVKKHYGSVDDAFLEIIVKNLGPSIYRKDAESVACTDEKELLTVRRNFLIKKLGFDKSEKDILDSEIKKVCESMKSTKIKYRATFYYILAKNLKKESALS